MTRKSGSRFSEKIMLKHKAHQSLTGNGGIDVLRGLNR
jgi:hypothetical protein